MSIRERFSRRSRSHMSRVLVLIAAALMLMLAPGMASLSLAAEAQAQAQAQTMDGPQNPRANYWRAVRGGTSGFSAVSGDEVGVLIHGGGQNWRQFRSNVLAPSAAWLIGAVVVALLLFALLRGRVRLAKGRSGTMVERFTVYQRVVHWFTVSLFLLLAITGLVLLYGRDLLVPLIGRQAFAVVAAASKEAHNLFGPMFILALLLFVSFVRDNIYARGDMTWLLRGGGFFNRHVSAGRFNMGEKTWFWLVILGGAAVSVTGVILDFPMLGQGRFTMEISHVVHTTAAVVLIAVALGHIYLGTWGTEGTLDGMTGGHVDRNWAEEHHDRWLPAEPGSTGARPQE